MIGYAPFLGQIPLRLGQAEATPQKWYQRAQMARATFDNLWNRVVALPEGHYGIMGWINSAGATNPYSELNNVTLEDFMYDAPKRQVVRLEQINQELRPMVEEGERRAAQPMPPAPPAPSIPAPTAPTEPIPTWVWIAGSAVILGTVIFIATGGFSRPRPWRVLFRI